MSARETAGVPATKLFVAKAWHHKHAGDGSGWAVARGDDAYASSIIFIESAKSLISRACREEGFEKDRERTRAVYKIAT